MNQNQINEELAKLIPSGQNIIDNMVKEVVDKEQGAALLLYLSAAVSEHISLQDCILKYEVKKSEEEQYHVHDYNSMIAERIGYEVQLRLVRRAPINLESDVVNHTVDSAAIGFVEFLRNKLKL